MAASPRVSDGPPPAPVSAAVHEPVTDSLGAPSLSPAPQLSFAAAAPQLDAAPMSAMSSATPNQQPAPLAAPAAVAPADPITSLLAMPGTFLNIATGLLAAVVSPFLGPAGPAAPTDTPVLWAVLAWVRRTFFNQTPTINPVQISQSADGVITGDLRPADADQDPLTFTVVQQPAHGTVVVNPDGTYTYTPDPTYAHLLSDTPLPDSFTVAVSDNGFNPFNLASYPILDPNFHVHGPLFFLQPDWGNSTTTTVNVAITTVNHAPVAANDSYSTNEDTPLTIAAPGLLGNDTDADHDPLSVGSVSDPSHGTMNVNGDGSFTYTPDADYHGPDSFTYKAADGYPQTLNGFSNTATVNITVTAANHAPVAADDHYSTAEDTPLTITAPGVLANDTDPDGDALTAQLVSNAAHGAVTQNADGSFTYTPVADYHGEDSFTYKASDGTTTSNTATVNIDVTPASGNHAPVAADDHYSTHENTPLTALEPGVLGNDTDADGDTLTAQLVSGASHGAVTQNADGSFTYTPVADYHGADSFTYKASDGTTTSNTATVNIDVAPPINTVIDTIPVGSAPTGVAVSPDGTRVYVTNALDNTVSVISNVPATIPVGNEPAGVAVSPDGAHVYVANANDNTVSVIDTATNTVVGTIHVGSFPNRVAVSPDGTRLYVANNHDNTLSVISGGIETPIPVGSGPVGVAVSRDGTRVFVTNIDDNTVSVIDVATSAVITIPVGTQPVGVAVSPDGARVYVANAGDNTLSVIDIATTNVTTIPVGTRPQGVAVSPDGDHVYTANFGVNTVSVIDTGTNTVTTTIGVGMLPVAVAVSQDGSRLFVTNEGDNTVSVISLR